MLGDSKVLRRLDKMLEDGLNGTFEESDYDETDLSKLESKWLRYLSASKLSHRRTEEERQKLRELISDISHQTKTPLANILLYTQLLQEQVLDEQSRQLVTEIQSQSAKLEFLIESLVKTSRLETGTFTFVKEKAEVSDLVESVLAQASAKAERRSIKLKAEPCACKAVFDMKWTREAIFNIVDNAVKYSREDTEVNVSVKEYEMFVCVAVKDEGMGIPEAEQPLVFGRFYRGSEVAQDEGVGIGLYLARQIIEEQGGYIQLSSEVGKGSEFSVFIPK
ncbi:HAMP domain-containing sensor histidine kinase [Ruminococcus sp.]|uniref:sensor histidine kinase n=1 Tax=Ruminococcus sp. TaxID=41978 RepID=UPI0025F28F6D|nr:HAMP domain-containing sensor histidine kinase [Ruminococcus sp.]